MRAMVAPAYDPRLVYQTCINSIADENLRYRLNLSTNDIVIAAADYRQRAEAKQLYTIPSNSCGNDDIALGSVTKKELKSVYSTHMVGRAKPARVIYDSILSQAPLGRCPFCGMGHASTLDHYLPKTKYPQLSAIPLNLVPSCKDCNTGKSTAIATSAEEQSLHPYFDHNGFTSEQWLFAEVISTYPETVRYFVDPPEHWDYVSKRRVQSHFEAFKLASRYGIEAANELAGRKQFLDFLRNEYGSKALVELLIKEAASHAENHVNSWQTALYQALVYKHRGGIGKFSPERHKSCLSSLVTCPRCSGLGEILNSTCDACSGAGAAIRKHFDFLGESVYEPVSCPDCIAGSPSCSTCNGEGKVPWEKAKGL